MSWAVLAPTPRMKRPIVTAHSVPAAMARVAALRPHTETMPVESAIRCVRAAASVRRMVTSYAQVSGSPTASYPRRSAAVARRAGSRGGSRAASARRRAGGRSFAGNVAEAPGKGNAGRSLTVLPGYGHIAADMAVMTIKSTYALDADSVRTLDRLARRWRVSKSEALRRAIRAAAGQAPREANAALKTLDRLQRSLRLTPALARGWARRVRDERRAASTSREGRRG